MARASRRSSEKFAKSWNERAACLADRLAQRRSGVFERFVGLRQGSREAHESVEHARVALVASRNPQLSKLLGVSLAIVAEWVALSGDHEGRRHAVQVRAKY